MNQEVVNEHSFRERYWNPNVVVDGNPAVQEGYRASRVLQYSPEDMAGMVSMTEVTLRDGEQQQIDDVTTEQRIAVFDRLVESGIDRIEIGHLGNAEDKVLAREIVRRVAESEREDSRYGRVKLQVLFGSQEDIIKEGVSVLQGAFVEQYGDDWQEVMADKVVVHVYDRVHTKLINTSSSPYTQSESAERVTKAAQHAIDGGFRHLSISGEAATAETPEVVTQFYSSITDYLLDNGAETVNVNLANTYGYSANSNWNVATLAFFNRALKHGRKDKVTTSIHMHNDVDNALDFTMASIVAGFDRVEGTMIGMGERPGNAALVNVMDRLLEQAIHNINNAERRSRVAERLATVSTRRVVSVDPSIIEQLAKWHGISQFIADTYGPDAAFRWQHTTLGNPYKFKNGSGPHDQIMAAAIENPEKYPPYRTYEWSITQMSIMGRAQADLLAIGDPDAVDDVTVGNKSGGGKTRMIKEGLLVRANEATIRRAAANFENYKAEVIKKALSGMAIQAA